MDVLSDVLSTVRLRGAVFFDVTCRAPWVGESPEGRCIVGSVLPGSEHLIAYHVVVQGGCWAGMPGDERPAQLAAGDVVVFPQGDPHVLTSAWGMRQPPDLSDYVRTADGLPRSVEYGSGDGSSTRLVCGFLGCDARPFNPLVAALPRRVVVRDGDAAGGGWLTRLVELALAESCQRRSGGESVLARVSELMFVEVVRRHLDRLGADQTGWLAGLRDPQVGRALSALHESPRRAWTLEDLAREVGTSRSVLAERFTQLVGQPPMQYLAQWRMQIAAGMLSNGSKVVEAAMEVGYDSEASFSRAFKRMVGVSPAMWRDRRADAAAGSAWAAGPS